MRDEDLLMMSCVVLSAAVFVLYVCVPTNTMCTLHFHLTPLSGSAASRSRR
jgi:hypothetical protein